MTVLISDSHSKGPRLGTPGGNRTRDLPMTSRALYAALTDSTELRGHHEPMERAGRDGERSRGNPDSERKGAGGNRPLGSMVSRAPPRTNPAPRHMSEGWTTFGFDPKPALRLGPSQLPATTVRARAGPS